MGLLNARRGSGQALDVDTVSTCLRVLSDVQVRAAHWVYAIVLYLTNPCLAPGAYPRSYCNLHSVLHSPH